MADYKDLMGEQQTEVKKPEHDVVAGSFGCSDCHETNIEAIHDRANRQLRWTCKNGHQNSANWL